jgi:hypothetical protein
MFDTMYISVSHYESMDSARLYMHCYWIDRQTIWYFPNFCNCWTFFILLSKEINAFYLWSEYLWHYMLCTSCHDIHCYIYLFPFNDYMFYFYMVVNKQIVGSFNAHNTLLHVVECNMISYSVAVGRKWVITICWVLLHPSAT